MSESPRVFLLALVITLSILALNLFIVTTTVKATQKVKNYLSNNSISSTSFEKAKPLEKIEEIKEYLPKRSVNYSKIKER